LAKVISPSLTFIKRVVEIEGGGVNWTTQTKSDKTSKIGNNSSPIRIVSVVIIYNTQSQVCVYLLARDPV